MIIAIDIGNSNIVISQIENSVINKTTRIETNKEYGIEEYNAQLDSIIDYSVVTDFLVSSVVPKVTIIFQKIIDQKSKKEPFLLDHRLKINMEINIPESHKLGSDLIAAAFSAKKQYGNNLLIIDIGTATTFSLINEKGDFEGCIIAPGPQTCLNALSGAASQLSHVDFVKAEKLIGKSTVDSMISGIYHGHIGMMREIIKNLNIDNLKIIATGGMASQFSDSKIFDHLDEDLVCKGLFGIWNLNR